MKTNKIDRISKNEERLNNINLSIKKIESALTDFKGNMKNIKLLNKYYSSKNWTKDKDDFEAKKIPTIKAGVLSEDAVWNMNEDIDDIIKEMESIIKEYRKKEL